MLSISWLDTGTHESLVDASNYIKILEDHQGIKVCCPEVIKNKHKKILLIFYLSISYIK